MLVAVAVAIVAAIILLLVVLKWRGKAGGRGDLLGPPPGLGAATRLAPPRPSTPQVDSGRSKGAAPLDDPPEAVAAEARKLLAQNQKIEAIKLVRAATHWSLGKAKDWAERQ